MQRHSSDHDLREGIARGVEALTTCVGSTLGPRGQNVILRHKQNRPVVTKDGVTVARFFRREDYVEDLGVQITKQASLKTNQDAGDGTTTSIILAGAIVEAATKFIQAGVSPTRLQRGLQSAAKAIAEFIDSRATPIKSEQDIENIATISANNDRELGKVIAMAVDRVGVDGSIVVENNHSPLTEVTLQEGFHIAKGYISDQFLQRPDSYVVKYRKPLILVSTQKLREVQALEQLFSEVYRSKQSLLVVGDVVEEQVLAALIFNHLKGNFECAAVNAPFYGRSRKEFLSDLALVTGARLVEESTNLADINLEWCGSAELVEITKNETTIMNGLGPEEAIVNRRDALHSILAELDLEEAQAVQDRIARLSGAVAVIKVGGTTDVEAQERTDRVEDAIEAVEAAIGGGILPGGGLVLLRASRELKNFSDDEVIIKILESALVAPLKTLAENSGLNYLEIFYRIQGADDPNYGFNFATGEYCDLVEVGVVDPLKVTRSALMNAVSAASTLLTANYAIWEE